MWTYKVGLHLRLTVIIKGHSIRLLSV